MSIPELEIAEFLSLSATGRLSSLFGIARDQPIVIVHLGDDDGNRALGGNISATDIGTLPAVFVGVGAVDYPAAELVDVVASNADELHEICECTSSQPRAGAALALLLRHGAERSISAGLIAESTTYSLLQTGPDFREWAAGRPPTAPDTVGASPIETGSSCDGDGDGDEVIVQRDQAVIRITLNRPQRHNAVDTTLSELLVEALTQALVEPHLRVIVDGNGPSFCSGGDLDTFCSFSSAVDAHAVRLTRSAGHLIAMMSDRVEVHLHGACIGAGIELAAFAATVVASPGVRISLPEVRFGLVPGAGGTVSMPRRIGRHRTALLSLTGRTIDFDTALRWGLVDQRDQDDRAATTARSAGDRSSRP